MDREIFSGDGFELVGSGVSNLGHVELGGQANIGKLRMFPVCSSIYKTGAAFLTDCSIIGHRLRFLSEV